MKTEYCEPVLNALQIFLFHVLQKFIKMFRPPGNRDHFGINLTFIFFTAEVIEDIVLDLVSTRSDIFMSGDADSENNYFGVQERNISRFSPNPKITLFLLCLKESSHTLLKIV